MLEYIRTHPKVVQTLLVVFIIPPFLLVGVEGLRSIGGSPAVAQVGNTKITQQEWENSQRIQLDNFRTRMGNRFDPKMFEAPEMKQNLFNALIDDKVIALELDKRLINISDASLASAVMATLPPDLIDEKGNIKAAEYQEALKRVNLTVQSHQESTRSGMRVEQFNAALQGSAFSPRTVTNRISDIFEQEREVQEFVLKAGDYAAKVNLTDAMVKDYYNKNAKLFELPESATIEYAVLNIDALLSQVEVKEEEVSAFYKQNEGRYSEAEKRRASHILVKMEKGASAEVKTAAKAKAEKILAQVKANKADFAKIAKEVSDDPGSAAVGGDLGLIEPKTMVPEFENAVNKLKKDELSELVESQFGYHIILVTELTEKRVKDFADVKAEILENLRRKQAEKKFADAAEIFSNVVDENTDNLKAVAEHPKLKLAIQTASNIGRNSNPALAPTAAYNNPKFLKALFEKQDVLKGKRNSDVIDIGSSTLVAAHVTNYSPTKVRPLAEVDAAIRSSLVNSEAIQMAKKEGSAKIAALLAKDDTTGFGEVKTVARRSDAAINQAAVAEVLKADTTKLPAFIGVELPGIGFGVYRISKVSQPAKSDEAMRQSAQENFSGMFGQQDRYTSLEFLKSKNKVKVLQPPVAATTSASATASASASASASK